MIRDVLHLSIGLFVILVSAAKYFTVTLVIALSTLSLVVHPEFTLNSKTLT